MTAKLTANGSKVCRQLTLLCYVLTVQLQLLGQTQNTTMVWGSFIENKDMYVFSAQTTELVT